MINAFKTEEAEIIPFEKYMGKRLNGPKIKGTISESTSEFIVSDILLIFYVKD